MFFVLLSLSNSEDGRVDTRTHGRERDRDIRIEKRDRE